MALTKTIRSSCGHSTLSPPSASLSRPLNQPVLTSISLSGNSVITSSGTCIIIIIATIIIVEVLGFRFWGVYYLGFPPERAVHSRTFPQVRSSPPPSACACSARKQPQRWPPSSQSAHPDSGKKWLQRTWRTRDGQGLDTMPGGLHLESKQGISGNVFFVVTTSTNFMKERT